MLTITVASFELSARLERRMAFSLSIADHELYLSIGSETLTGKATRHPLA